jgi:hypothetical protein
MKITETKLRRIISEMLLQEMPYAGSLGVRRGAPSWGPGNLDIDMDMGMETALTRAEKFAKSKFFNDQAVKLFGNIPIPVWHAAIIGSVGAGMNPVVSEDEDYVYPAQKHFERMMISDRVGLAKTFPKGIKALEAAGFIGLDKIERGDLVIIGVAAMVYPGFNATPWMTLHTVFDDDGTEKFYDKMCPSYTHLYKIMSNMDTNGDLEGHDPKSFIRFFEDFEMSMMKPRMPSPFTMAAGREGVRGRDALAECMVQELLDRNRLQLNWDAISAEERPVAETVIRIIKAAAEEFRQRMPGHTLVAIVN